MEPFISPGFDGPQFDDVLGAQRHYGDPLEKSGGNNTVATATPLNLVAHGSTVSRGTHADDAVISANRPTSSASMTTPAWTSSASPWRRSRR